MLQKSDEALVKLLLVDDDRQLLSSMGDWLGEQGFEVFCCTTSREALKTASQQKPDLALIDLRLGSEDGMQLLKDLRRQNPAISPLMMTGYGTPDTAIEAIQNGAFDLLTKPLFDQELLNSLDRAVNQRSVIAENEKLRLQLDEQHREREVIGSDPQLRKTFEIIESVAETRATLLITGESGTGKSMVARTIHNRSDRKKGPFVEVACGALPENLLESELFGHVAGSFTGATSSRDGKFKLADGGTIFLDEIGTASPAMQVKLLRVLQEFEFEQVGGSRTFKVDTRVILATNEDLAKAVAEGRFREDLFYRINIINLQMPALRQRAGDIPLLAAHFLEKISRELGRSFEGFEHEAMNLMQSWQWPGNIRELQNAIERAVLLGREPRIRAADLPPGILAGQGTAVPAAFDHPVPQSPGQSDNTDSAHRKKTLKEALEEPERQIILESLRQHEWSRSATAEALGINRTTLYKKMIKLGIDNPRFAWAD